MGTECKDIQNPPTQSLPECLNSSQKRRTIYGCQSSFTSDAVLAQQTRVHTMQYGGKDSSNTWAQQHGLLFTKTDLTTATAKHPTYHEQRPTLSLNVALFPGGLNQPLSVKIITLEPADHGGNILSSQGQMPIAGLAQPAMPAALTPIPPSMV